MQDAPQIHSGQVLFVDGSSESFGAVRTVRPHGRPEFVAWIENAGEFTVALSAVKSAHGGKVVVDLAHLDPDLRKAIGHAHDRES